jgi:serine protease
MAQRLRGRTTSAVAAGAAAACLAMAAAPALADTVRGQEWWLNSLHVTQAWLSTRGQGVTVAVLDTGVDPAQPDLAGSVTTGPDFTGSGRTAGGPFWGAHGTAMASLIAGHGHGPGRGDGIIGIAPQARILSIRVTLEPNDPMLKDAATVAALPRAIARGINAAVRQGAQVIDLPLDPAAVAGGNTGGGPGERAAVAAALRRGVVLVAPAGDDGNGADSVNYPAGYPGVISAGAFNASFTRAAFSSGQPYVTLTAPGDGVIAASGPTGYAKLASTSAASAIVAGVAALIRAQFPALSPAQVKQALTTSTAFRPAGGQQNGAGAGTVDAAAALIAAAKIYTGSAGASASPVNPTPPAAPKVRPHTTSLWDAVRYPVLGIVAILVIAVIALIAVRSRQRRELDAQLAPLRAAAQASRAARPGPPGPPGPDGPDGPVPTAPGKRRAAPFDDPEFVPPSYHNPALRSPAMTGPVLANPVFGDPGQGGGTFNRPAPARPAAGDQRFGTAAADLPSAPAGAALAGDPFSSPAAAPAPFGPASADAGGPEPGAAAGRPQRAPFGEPPTVPAHRPAAAQRLNAVRTPKTTGHPPWGPAEKPQSELPWMEAPSRKPAPGRVVPPRRPVPPGQAAAPAGMGTAPVGMGTGPAGMGTGPAGMGTGPAGMGTGPAGMGTGPAGMGTGPAGMGTGPAGMGAGPAGMGAGLAREGTGPAGMGTGPAREATGSAGVPPVAPSAPGRPPGGRAPSGLPQRAAAGRSPFPGLEPPPPGGTGGPPVDLFGPTPPPEPAPRRVYTWNPADTTVNMPAVRVDDPPSGQD